MEPDGSLTSWQPTPPTSTLRSGAATFLFEKYLYVLGGEGDNRDSATSIERAEILHDGSLSPWEVVGHLATGRWGLSAVLVGRDLYVIGGHDATDPLAVVEHARLDEAGNLGRWSRLANLNVPRWALSAVHVDGYIFALGGQDKQNAHRTVERARIAEDGLLEGWTMISSMTERRHGARVVAHDRRLIVTGGYSGIGAGATPPQEYLSSVESATLSPGGDLGSWSNVSNMRSRRGYHTAAVVGESLYVVGGISPSAASSSVERIDLDRLQKA